MVRSLVLVVLLAACGNPASAPRAPSNTGELAKFAYVPADTPYVVAWVDPFPDAIWERWMSSDLAAKVLAVNRATLAAKSRSERTVGDRITLAYLDEIEGGDMLAALERTGFGKKPRLVVYGLSVYPAVHAEIASAKRLRATIERILRSAEVPYDVVEVGGVEVLATTTRDDDVAVFGFPSEHEAVGGLFPAEHAERYTRQLLGLDPPKTSLAGTGRLQRLIDEAGGGYLVGFLDLRALLRELDDDLDATCRAEALALIELAPAVETFSTVIEDLTFGMTLRLVTDPQVRDALADVVVPVPGLTALPAGDPLLIAGLGVDLDAVDALARRAAGEIRAHPFRCEKLQGLNRFAAQIGGGILQHIPPPFDRLRGMQMTLDGMNPAVARLIAIHDRPLDLLAMLAQAVPPLGAVQVRDDGTPVDVDLSALGIPGVSRALVAVAGTRLAAVVGGDAAAVHELIAAAPAADAPLAVFGMDFGRFTELFGGAPFADQPEMAALMDAYGYFSYSVHVDRRGLALRMTMEVD